MKKQMMRFALVILSACLLFSLAACAPKKFDNTALSEKTQAIANTLVQDYGSTSVQYAIIDDGEIILSGGSGVYSLTDNRSITKDNMFGVGSTSKMFSTAAAMMLAEDGLLDIDAPIIDYIPEFKMADERYKQITARMLMNHSSGLFGTSPSNTSLFDDADKSAHDTLLERLSVQRLKADPGESSIYCNDGFSILEILVERISGIEYTEFLSENIFKPLKLNNTKTPLDDFDRNKLVKAYMPPFEEAVPVDTVNSIGAGGVYSTAQDLCRFSEVLMGNKPEILSEESALMMQSEEYKNGIWPQDHDENMDGYGLGWDTVHGYPFGDYGIDVAMKTGDTEFYHSVIVTIPKYDIAMAVLSSGGSSNNEYAFAATILQELLQQKGIIKEISPLRTIDMPEKADMPQELSAHSGVYANAGEQFSITVKDGVLTVSSAAGEIEYVYIGDNVFSSEDGSIQMQFVEPGDGRTCIQINQTVTLPGVGQYVKCSFDSQKIESVNIPDDLLDVWKKRAGKCYFLVSEKSTSQYYRVLMGLALNDSFENGYACACAVITDENTAENKFNFRGVTDLVFYTQDNTEYLMASDWVFICEDCIPDLTADTKECNISLNGFAQYYNIGTDTAGKDLTVTLSEGEAYAVYDENGMCVNYTTITHDNTTVLPSGGKVVFIGKAGDAFGIELK